VKKKVGGRKHRLKLSKGRTPQTGRPRADRPRKSWLRAKRLKDWGGTPIRFVDPWTACNGGGPKRRGTGKQKWREPEKVRSVRAP